MSKDDVAQTTPPQDAPVEDVPSADAEEEEAEETPGDQASQDMKTMSDTTSAATTAVLPKGANIDPLALEEAFKTLYPKVEEARVARLAREVLPASIRTLKLTPADVSLVMSECGYSKTEAERHLRLANGSVEDALTAYITGVSQ